MNTESFYTFSVDSLVNLLNEINIAFSLQENKTDYSLPNKTTNECFITFTYHKKSKQSTILVSTKSHKDLGIYTLEQLFPFITKRYKSVKVQSYLATESLHEFQCSILLYGGK